MSKYLVINFNRYDTNKSREQIVEADSFPNALKTSMDIPPGPMSDGFDEEEYKYLMVLFEQVSDSFACVALEEADILIYII